MDLQKIGLNQQIRNQNYKKLNQRKNIERPTNPDFNQKVSQCSVEIQTNEKIKLHDKNTETDSKQSNDIFTQTESSSKSSLTKKTAESTISSKVSSFLPMYQSGNDKIIWPSHQYYDLKYLPISYV